MQRRDFIKLSTLLAGSISLSTQLSGCQSPRSSQNLPAVEFSHGVASGDPTADAVVLWTRALPMGSQRSGLVHWQIATSPDFATPLREGTVKSASRHDFTVKVDVRDLPAATTLYYRFFTDENSSPIGVTTTLPKGVVDKVKFAVFSCSNYPAGYFTPYAAAAIDESIDVVLHLGDYIYEYQDGGYATENAVEIGRQFMPGNEGELLTLRDYRLRYATYRQDKGLLSLHQNKPFIAVWDDHEIANDTYAGGAQNHSPAEGDFSNRRAAAIQAYYEWLPIRPPMGDDNPQIYRYFEFGNLVSLYMLDTRVIGRQQQIAVANYKDTDGHFDSDGFFAAINDPKRTLLGQEQFNWLRDTVATSNSRWHLLGQQVLMGKMHFPAEIFAASTEAVPEIISSLVRIKQKQAAGLAITVQEQQRLALTMPYNTDAWTAMPPSAKRCCHCLPTPTSR